MRYIVQFFDRTIKKVPHDVALKFIWAQKTGDIILYRGSSYSGKSVASVKPIVGFYLDKQTEAGIGRERLFFCKYGFMHDYDEGCVCRNVPGRTKFLLPQEVEIMNNWNDKLEIEYERKLALPMAK